VCCRKLAPRASRLAAKLGVLLETVDFYVSGGHSGKRIAEPSVALNANLTEGEYR
jgi:hypothetical protein